MRVMLLLVSSVLLTGPPVRSAEAVDASDPLARVRAMAGEWRAELPGFGTITSVIRVVSNGAAVEEEIGTSTDREISVYSRKGRELLLTHFCAMTAKGHVVRLVTHGLRDSATSVDLELEGTANLRSRAAPHMRHVRIEFADADHVTERWTKTEAGKDTVFELRFQRVG